jgi:hypothetical protein
MPKLALLRSSRFTAQSNDISGLSMGYFFTKLQHLTMIGKPLCKNWIGFGSVDSHAVFTENFFNFLLPETPVKT